MNVWLALRRLLPLLAVLSLALTPVTAPAATAGMHGSMAQGRPASGMDVRGMDVRGMPGMDHAAMGHHGHASPDMAGLDMDDMPCCPKADAPKPDCAKGCPMMALCLGNLTSLPPDALRIPTPVARRASVTWPEPASLSSVCGAPSPEPPRA